MTDDPYRVSAGGDSLLKPALMLAIVILVGLIVLAPRGGTGSAVPAEMASEPMPESPPVEWDADRWPLRLGPAEGADRWGSDDWRAAANPREKKEGDPGL